MTGAEACHLFARRRPPVALDEHRRPRARPIARALGDKSSNRRPIGVDGRPDFLANPQPAATQALGGRLHLSGAPLPHLAHRVAAARAAGWASQWRVRAATMKCGGRPASWNISGRCLESWRAPLKPSKGQADLSAGEQCARARARAWRGFCGSQWRKLNSPTGRRGPSGGIMSDERGD